MCQREEFVYRCGHMVRQGEINPCRRAGRCGSPLGIVIEQTEPCANCERQERRGKQERSARTNNGGGGGNHRDGHKGKKQTSHRNNGGRRQSSATQRTSRPGYSSK